MIFILMIELSALINEFSGNCLPRWFDVNRFGWVCFTRVDKTYNSAD